jgi:hypothetical protein
MPQNFSKSFEVLKNWDSLPDDAVISTKITALVLGCAERTIRYHPKLKRIEVSRGRYGFRVGNVRLIARGEDNAA